MPEMLENFLDELRVDLCQQPSKETLFSPPAKKNMIARVLQRKREIHEISTLPNVM